MLIVPLWEGTMERATWTFIETQLYRTHLEQPSGGGFQRIDSMAWEDQI
jgi:hypothetical protein